MNGGMKQRVVGAVVLAAAALVIWSVLFTSPVAPRVDRLTQIPPAPKFERFSVAEPEPVANLPALTEPLPEPVPEPESATQPASKPESTTSDEAAKSTEVNKEGELVSADQQPDSKASSTVDQSLVPIAWSIQVASLGERDKAESLKAALMEKGYRSYTKVVTAGGKEFVRVYVGPKLDKSSAETIKQEIDKAFKVDSMIVRFQHR